jgi:hypothetical protein
MLCWYNLFFLRICWYSLFSSRSVTLMVQWHTANLVQCCRLNEARLDIILFVLFSWTHPSIRRLREDKNRTLQLTPAVVGNTTAQAGLLCFALESRVPSASAEAGVSAASARVRSMSISILNIPWLLKKNHPRITAGRPSPFRSNLVSREVVNTGQRALGFDGVLACIT